MTPDQASDIAISGLQYIAGDENELTRFLALTGIAGNEIRQLANTQEFMVAVLDYFLGNEATLLAFSASAGIEPADIQKARHALSPPQGNEVWG